MPGPNFCPALASNRRHLALLGCLWLAAVGHLASHEPPSSPRVLVQPHPGIETDRLAALHRHLGCRLIRTHPHLGGLTVLASPAGTPTDAVIHGYQASGLVRFAEPDALLHPCRDPDDPAYLNGTQWHLHNTGQNGGQPDADVDAPEGWDLTHLAPEVVVAVVDSGLRLTHEDLAGNLWTNQGEIPGNGLDDDGNGFIDDVHGIDAIASTGDPSDDLGHGTQVAGLIGAAGDNQRGGTGLAWRVQLMPLRFMDARGSGSVSDAVACLEYARQHGAHLVNCSWGGARASLALETALERLLDDGVIVVAAAGNVGKDLDLSPEYPASYSLDHLVVVTTTTRTDSLAASANYGQRTVHLGAPGVDLFSTMHTSDQAYGFVQGSSMAAPVATGVLALLKARFPEETPSRLIQRLLATSDPLPALTGRCVSGGRVNLRQALAENWMGTPATLTCRREPGGAFSLLLEGDPGTIWALEQASESGPWSQRSTHQIPPDGAVLLGPWTADGTTSFFRARRTGTLD